MALAICDNCGKKVSKKLGSTKKNKHNFCDRKCYSEWMRKNPEFCKNRQKRGWWKNGSEKNEMHEKWKKRENF